MEPNEAPPMRFGPQGLEYEVVFSVKIENGGRADVPFRYSLRLDDLPDDVEIVSIKTGNNEELTAVTSDGKYVLVKDQDIIPETKHTYEVTLRSTMTKTIDLSFVLEHGFLPVQQDGKWVGDAQGNP
ncbi:MAG: hypothetical protein LBC26_06205 [Oscillospiraceae bacterium]|jgi:hypothetical protein|nr:hypothetical protein [Oscillospiraceae bacterium]